MSVTQWSNFQVTANVKMGPVSQLSNKPKILNTSDLNSCIQTEVYKSLKNETHIRETHHTILIFSKWKSKTFSNTHIYTDGGGDKVEPENLFKGIDHEIENISLKFFYK